MKRVRMTLWSWKTNRMGPLPAAGGTDALSSRCHRMDSPGEHLQSLGIKLHDGFT